MAPESSEETLFCLLGGEGGGGGGGGGGAAIVCDSLFAHSIQAPLFTVNHVSELSFKSEIREHSSLDIQTA